MTTPVPIANVAHFIWLGAQLPPIAWLAVRAARDRGGFERMVLHTQSAALADDSLIVDLIERVGLQLKMLESTSQSAPDANAQIALDALDLQLQSPAARADLWRLRVLWQHGGVYLDADAICLQSFRDLLHLGGFAGLEPVALPNHVVHGRHPGRWLRAGLALATRDVASRMANPIKAFAAVAPLHWLACNNAILGACATHPLIGQLLHDALALPCEQALKLYELGPRLLERATDNRSTADFKLLPPELLFPLGPEICVAYVQPDPLGRLGKTPHPAAVCAHLYDSVLSRRVGPLDTPWLTGPGRQTLLGQMVQPWLDELEQLAKNTKDRLKP